MATTTIRKRLYTGLAIVITSFLVLQAFSLKGAFEHLEEMQGLYTVNMLGTEQLVAAQEAIWQLRNDTGQFVIADAGQRKDLLAQQEKLLKTLRENLHLYSQGHRTADEKEAFKELQVHLAQFTGALPEWQALIAANRHAEAIEWRRRLLAAGDQLAKSLVIQVEMQKDEADKLMRATRGSIYRESLVLTIVSIATVLFGIFFAVRTSRRVVKPLGAAVNAVRQIAGGDLASRLAEEGDHELEELAIAVNRLADHLQSTLTTVGSSANQLAKVATALQGNAHQVVQAAEVQSQSANDTSVALHDINQRLGETATAMLTLTGAAVDTSSASLQMASSVEEVAANMEQLTEAVETVSSSITEVVTSIQEVGSSTQFLLGIADNTAASISEIDATVQQVELNVRETAAISETMLNDAERGKTAVDATMNGIQEISRSAAITAEVVNGLSQRAIDIGSILSVIDEVAEQTNLLALNAAIIAAQAGEHGKGFAVVADEIKELADRTRVSTREIAQLIEGVQEETQRAVEAINQAETSIDEGVQLSQRSGEALVQILNGVRQATTQINRIARATQEQARGSHEIHKQMENVSSMVSQIASATREQASGSNLIIGAVEKMKDLAGQVRQATREQKQTSTVIAKSAEQTAGLVKTIKQGCDEQKEGSQRIGTAMDQVLEASSVNLTAGRGLDQAIHNLTAQVAILQKHLDAFGAGAEGAPAGAVTTGSGS